MHLYYKFAYHFSAVGAAVLNDRLYVCGGYDGVSSLNTVEYYNPDKNELVGLLKSVENDFLYPK